MGKNDAARIGISIENILSNRRSQEHSIASAASPHLALVSLPPSPNPGTSASGANPDTFVVVTAIRHPIPPRMFPVQLPQEKTPPDTPMRV